MNEYGWIVYALDAKDTLKNFMTKQYTVCQFLER